MCQGPGTGKGLGYFKKEKTSQHGPCIPRALLEQAESNSGQVPKLWAASTTDKLLDTGKS